MSVAAAAASRREAPQASIPRATYRLQLHRDFGFDSATALLPYLDRLGISHVYCSPILRAGPESMHGYDVIDHGVISPELGGRAGFERLSSAARALGMGLLIDFVPNHMAVIGVDNAWWRDVLEHGEASRFAHYFDIDWRPDDVAKHGKVLLPVLGTSYGAALDQAEIRVAATKDDGRLPLAVAYYEHRFPIDPRTWPMLLRAASRFADAPETRDRLQAIAQAAELLPTRERRGDADNDRSALVAPVKAQLSGLLREDPEALPALERYFVELSSAAGRDDLHALLEAQAYRLGHWRVAADDINYRRFFNVNSLAALRVEQEDVFEATHAIAFELTSSGLVDGVRIDHPDGLRDPRLYFERLQRGYARRVGLAEDVPAQGAGALYVVAEKITAAHEDMPADWAVHGTTGYRFASVVTGLFVEAKQAPRFERIWRAASGATESYAEIVLAARLGAATVALGSELTVLAKMLTSVTEANRNWRDHGHQTLRSAIAEVAGSMPVYRTYVVDRASPQDLVFIDWAVAAARARSELGDLDVFDMLRACLRLELPEGASANARDAARRFVWRFQQFCAPVAAKGVEDTALYRYHRLISLNDVGSDPATFGVTVKAFHGASADRAARWPHTMLATSTHDNKRSEDVRARICVLSETPALWRLGLRRWWRLARSLRREVDGRTAPSAPDEVLLYQTLLGSLPTGPIDEATLAAYRERIVAYMTKATREAHLETSWARPDCAYEEALVAFIQGLLARPERNQLLDDLRSLADDLAWFGGLNSAAMAMLKFTSPGVPDLYQGNELMDFSLVDPDNRRPVDYALRAQRLDDVMQAWQMPDSRAQTLQKWAGDCADGRLKLCITWRLLTLRRECAALFRDGGYIALPAKGAARDHVVAFARQCRGETLIVVATRLLRTLTKGARRLPGSADWGDTTIDLSRVLRVQGGRANEVAGVEVLSGATLPLTQGGVRVADLLQTLPFAAFRISEEAAS